MPIGRVVVLGASDDDAAAALIGRLLSEAGAEVAVTPSTAATAEAVETEDVSTVVVTNGATDLVAGLRASTSRRQRNVSVVAVVDTTDDADAALEAGADSVLMRPVEAERLVEAVSSLA